VAVVMSKRERYIGFATLGVLGVVFLQWVIVGPLWERKAQLDASLADLSTRRQQDETLVATADRAARYWNDLSSRRLPRDVYEADQMINNLSNWAQESGLSLSSVKAERTEKDKDFYRKTFRAVGGGGMSQVGRFLYRVQTASVPARITDLTLSSKKEGTDDLSLSVGVATIYPIPENEKTRTFGAPGAAQAEAR